MRHGGVHHLVAVLQRERHVPVVPPLHHGLRGRITHSLNHNLGVCFHLRTVVNPVVGILHVQSVACRLHIERIRPQVSCEVVARHVVGTVNHVRPPVVGGYRLIVSFVDVQLAVFHVVTLVTTVATAAAHAQRGIRSITSLTAATYHFLCLHRGSTRCQHYHDCYISSLLHLQIIN